GGNREIAPCFRAAPLALFAFGIIPLMNEHRTTEEQKALDAQYMALALEEARAAGAAGEVPIGAVVVYEPIDRGTRRPLAEPRVIARGRNRRETDRDPAGHAEFLAMKEAARVLDAWRLTDCTVYVTLEPCIMCALVSCTRRGWLAVCTARPDQKAGAVGTLYDIHADTRLGPQFQATGGVCERSA
ncbi:MAG: nucleoside deaminase, partial [Adlercreutzia equolifaciens]